MPLERVSESSRRIATGGTARVVVKMPSNKPPKPRMTAPAIAGITEEVVRFSTCSEATVARSRMAALHMPSLRMLLSAAIHSCRCLA